MHAADTTTDSVPITAIAAIAGEVSTTLVSNSATSAIGSR